MNAVKENEQKNVLCLYYEDNEQIDYWEKRKCHFF